MYEQFEKATSLIPKDDINAMNINTTPNICVSTLNTTIKLNTLSEKIAARNIKTKQKTINKKNTPKKTRNG